MVEWLGVIAIILSLVNSWILFSNYRKDKPLISIEKVKYERALHGHDLSNKEYAKKVINGELNHIKDKELRILTVKIANKGNKIARLKEVQALFNYKSRKFSPNILNFFSSSIKAGDFDNIRLFFDFDQEIIKEIEKELPYEFEVKFTFAHKIIIKKFTIGRHSIISAK